MKKIFLFAAFALCGLALNAQTTVKIDKDGNYQAVKVPQTVETLTANATKSQATYTDDKGQKSPVYLSKNGKAFIIATSKSGNLYRRYLKVVSE